MKKQKGISLVALIITIIVMLILAGVIITSAVSDGGLIDRAQSTIKEKERAEVEEIVKTSYVYKTTAATTMVGQLNLEKTAKSICSNLIESGYNVLNAIEIKENGEKYKTLDIKDEKIDIEVEGRHGKYTGTVEKSGLRDSIVAVEEKGKNEVDNIIIPEGGEYTSVDGTVYNAGENFPEVVAEGDVYVYGDYKYTYRYCYFDGDWFDKKTYEEDFGVPLDGWSAIVVDKTKTNYGEILSSINGEDLTNLVSTFSECDSLVTAPVIPNTVIDMFYTFCYCEKLEEAPIIPNGVINMNSTFSNCTSLIKAPIIPDNVIDMGGTFYECVSLTQVSNIPSKVEDLGIAFYHCKLLTTVPAIPSTVDVMEETFSGCLVLENEIEINANPSEFKGCFGNTEKQIILTGAATDETKERLSKTASGNVTWK